MKVRKEDKPGYFSSEAGDIVLNPPIDQDVSVGDTSSPDVITLPLTLQEAKYLLDVCLSQTRRDDLKAAGIRRNLAELIRQSHAAKAL